MSKLNSMPFCPALQSLCLILPSNFSDLGSIALLFTALQRLNIDTRDPDRAIEYSPEDKCDLADVAACTQGFVSLVCAETHLETSMATCLH